MNSNTAIVLPDGTRCYTGPTCKKHGTAATNLKVTQLKSQIDNLFVDKIAPSAVEPATPEWWSDYHQDRFDRKVELLNQFGLEKASLPTFHDSALRYGYVSVDTGDKNTQLIVDTDGALHYKMGENHYFRAWMYKNGKPVAMLRFSAYPKDYVAPEGTYPYVESEICDIEVNKDHKGNKYGLEIIRQVEKNVLAGRLIHSGGSYTPEGRQSLGGKLPYTHMAKNTYEKVLKKGKLPESRFDSMSFVHDWDQLQPLN